MLFSDLHAKTHAPHAVHRSKSMTIPQRGLPVSFASVSSSTFQAPSAPAML